MILKENEKFSVNIKELEWDSSIFGFKCGNMDVIIKNRIEYLDPFSGLPLKECITEAKEENYKFLTAKVDTEYMPIVNACLENNGKLIDTELTFHKKRRTNVGEKVEFPEHISVKKFKTFWDDSLFDIAKTLRFSRFFIDENIKKETAQIIWEKSIYNSCNGRADYSIICFYNDKPAGIMNIFEKNRISDIFIIAVIPEYQNKGLGRRMMNYYEANLDVHIQEQTVETQLINYQAQKLYIDHGYKVIKSKHIIHFWF
jgi:ribosomal protein S18 acetylase RimI-like enzyme